MKKILLFASAVTTIFAASSCQKEIDHLGGDINVNFDVSAGEPATKAIADATNIDVLYWEIYNTADIETVSSPLGEGKVEDNDSDKNFLVELKLLADQDYTIVFWAQVNNQSHYDVTDLRCVEIVDYADENANDETRAAFFGTYKFHTSNGVGINEEITLYRPFSQINLGSTTYETSLNCVDNGVIKVESTEMTVTSIANKFNTLEGLGIADQPSTVTFKAAATPNGTADETQQLLTVNEETYYWLGMNYLIVTGNSDNVDVDVILNTNMGTVTHNIANVPVKENYRTNILGNLLTTGTTFNVVIDERFEVPDIVVDPTVAHPSDASDIAAAIVNPDINVINLTCPIDESGFGIDQDDPVKELTVNMNGYPISNGNADGAYDFHIWNESTVIFNDANFPEAGGMINAAYGATVIFNSGVSNILSTATAQRHSFYAAGVGTTITVNDGTFTFDAYRQRTYACAVNGAIIYIKGGTYGVAPNHPRWTAPIYTENGGQVIITGGTFGFDPTEWLAEGYEAIKSGNSWTVVYVAETADALAEAFANPDVDVVNITAPIDANEPLLFEDDRELTINMDDQPFSTGSSDQAYDVNIFAGKVTFNDANFPEAGGMLQVAYGAEVIFNSGVSTIAAGTNSQRYNIYAASPETKVTINGGTFAFEPYKKRSYVCALNNAVVYITGGTFGPAPTHPNWKYPIYTESNGQVIITGGTFGFDPSEWVAEGYQAVQSGSNWTVEAI